MTSDETLERRLLRASPHLSDEPRLKVLLLDGLRALDALPRTDPFWNNTNGEATLFKLSERCHRRLLENPEDSEARWILFADTLGAPQLAWKYITPVLEHSPEELDFVLHCTRKSWLAGGWDLERQLLPAVEALVQKRPALRGRRGIAELLDHRNPFRSTSAEGS